MASSRLIWLDILKGSLILLVILGHAIQYCLPEGECESNYWWNLIYSFHMPAFMAASGFVNYRSSDFQKNKHNKDIKVTFNFNLLKRRTFQLLIPFFAWSFIKWIVSSEHSLNSLINITFNSGGFFWFLWALWIITVCSIFCNFLSYKFKLSQVILYSILSIILILSMVVFNVRILGFQYISYYFVFYSIGFFIHKYDQVLISKPYILTILFFIWLFLGSFWNMHELPYFLKNINIIPSVILQYCYRFVTAIIAVYLLFCIFPLLFKNIEGNKLLTYLGQNSLAIYGLQGVVIAYICEFTIKSHYIEKSVSQVIVSFLFTLLICICFLLIGNKQSFLKKIFFGKV